jgi:excisionase family DNA binding protein
MLYVILVSGEWYIVAEDRHKRGRIMAKHVKATSSDDEVADWVTVGYVAKKLGVDDSTVRRYIKAGRFPALTIPSGEGRNTYRIPRIPFEAFLQQHLIIGA